MEVLSTEAESLKGMRDSLTVSKHKSQTVLSVKVQVFEEALLNTYTSEWLIGRLFIFNGFVEADSTEAHIRMR